MTTIKTPSNRLAYDSGILQREISSLDLPAGKKTKAVSLSTDEELDNFRPEALPKMATVFQPDGGTVTLGNTSKLADGAAACVLMTRKVIDFCH